MSKKGNGAKKTAPAKRGKKRSTLDKNGAKPAFLTGLAQFGLTRRFTDNLERLFDDLNHFRIVPFLEKELALANWKDLETPMWAPPIEIREKDGLLTVRAELPGMKKEDVEVEITDDALVISGERREEDTENREGYYRSERSYGSFYRSVPLPPGVTAEKAGAEFKDGVLEVKLHLVVPKKKGHKLAIGETDETAKAIDKTAETAKAIDKPVETAKAINKPADKVKAIKPAETAKAVKKTVKAKAAAK